MYKEKVSLNINGLSNVFSNYKGQKIRLESDKSEKGWICLSVGETGSSYLCSAFPGEYYILFEK